MRIRSWPSAHLEDSGLDRSPASFVVMQGGKTLRVRCSGRASPTASG
jgi:hypothetical protein